MVLNRGYIFTGLLSNFIGYINSKMQSAYICELVIIGSAIIFNYWVLFTNAVTKLLVHKHTDK